MDQEGIAQRGILLLRGHHLLCIQGFRGYGYSPDFVEGMWSVVNRLTAAPETVTEVVDRCDQICLACPHFNGEVCRQKGEESNERRIVHDRRVLSHLGLEGGDHVRWSAVLDRIRSCVVPDDLTQLCGTCQWRPAGYCADGLKKLLTELEPQPM